MDHECKKEEIINDIKKDLDKLFEIKDVVIELKTLVSLQIEQNKKQDDIIQKQSETLIKISDTVIQQGDFIKRLNTKFDQLDDTFFQSNIEQIKTNSISFQEMLKEFIFRYLPPIILAGMLYFLMEQLK